MDKEDKVPQYKTIKRIQKNYLVRCNESLKNIIPGAGVKPVSAIRRIENELKAKRKELSTLTEEELMSNMDPSKEKKVKNAQEYSAAKQELQDRIRQLEKQLQEYELL
mmetsp:Transcript_16400/g.35426  ORF Transcript_16400/g.35426 Transcript_16400/m.35426 type:complete len:108 (-) Transcript_16400:88-411(-)|eukprot:CAMPEP_0206419384 /NCGR_PEP_ID=MMETSP0324_2-20121206/75_1 /ASSEMBLY_ACC=CAM_ASM_000836 /TAXON_ID=2866 /ORGANISM="Crypthecodinium cohnii, Strain Seligo" /LENGTH=107 /DNA_ID=CAMNT_0053882787 /DNA_START=166 /DNA_END=489 /DNA_ORIENTATION=+